MPDFLSGKIELFHVVFPTVISTRIEPNPAAFVDAYFFFISSETFLLICKNRHAPKPGKMTMFDVSLYTRDDAGLVAIHAEQSPNRCCNPRYSVLNEQTSAWSVNHGRRGYRMRNVRQ